MWIGVTSVLPHIASWYALTKMEVTLTVGALTSEYVPLVSRHRMPTGDSAETMTRAGEGSRKERERGSTIKKRNGSGKKRKEVESDVQANHGGLPVV